MKGTTHSQGFCTAAQHVIFGQHMVLCGGTEQTVALCSQEDVKLKEINKKVTNKKRSWTESLKLSSVYK
jgi:hypothetical protein